MSNPTQEVLDKYRELRREEANLSQKASELESDQQEFECVECFAFDMAQPNELARSCLISSDCCNAVPQGRAENTGAHGCFKESVQANWRCYS